MTSRIAVFYRHGLVRLGQVSCHRCFSDKVDKSHPVGALSKLSTQKKNLTLTYINQLYRGQDNRLKELQSTMDKVLKVRNELGPLNTVDDLISKVGLPEQEALSLINTIIQICSKKRRSIQFCYPPIGVANDGTIKDVLAIHTSLYCIAWAHLEESGRVKSWHRETLPLGEKQKHPIDCVNAVMSFKEKLPYADVYVLETPDSKRARNSSEALDGFLLGHINCAVLTTLSCLHSRKDEPARIHYMNRNLVPILFDLSVGVEIVSRFRVVEKLIQKSIPEDKRAYGNIILDAWLEELFLESKDKMKEELSIPLLAAMAAMDLIVRRNPTAIEKVLTA